MYSLPKNVYRERKDFSKIKTTVPIPNLIEIQRKSYERFLQMNRLPSEREDQGLQSVFKSVFPISDFRENSSLEFIEYSIGNWECKCGKLTGLHHLRKPCSGCGHTLVADPYGDREVLCPRCGKGNHARGDVCDICGNTIGLKLKYDVDECQERGMTYAVPLKVTIRLVVWNKDPETGVKTIRDIKEQEVYFGDIPLMGDHGTFIINGTERVIVSQMHRSPGAFFHSEDKNLFIAQIIPYRGSWVEFEYDAKNLLYVRIDRKRKFLATVFLRALGLRGADEIIRSFYTVDRLHLRGGVLCWAVADSLVGLRAAKDIVVPGEHFTIQAGKKITKNAVEALKRANVEAVEVSDAELEGAFAASDVVDPSTGEVFVEAPISDASDVDAAYRAAEAAFPAWRDTSLTARSNIFFAFRNLVWENREELARLVTRQPDARGLGAASARHGHQHVAVGIDEFARLGPLDRHQQFRQRPSFDETDRFLSREVARIRGEVAGRHVNAVTGVVTFLRLEQIAQRADAALRGFPAFAAHDRNAA